MRFASMRRVVLACVAAAAALAMMVPGLASARLPKPEPDVLEQCSGAQYIESEGSTFQAPAEWLWTGVNSEKGNEALFTGFNYSELNPLACAGFPEQGSGQKPEIYYNQESTQRGSGSCLRGWGRGINHFGEEVGGKVYPRVGTFPFCGTDEAPNQATKEEFENPEFMAAGGEAGNGEALETIPVAQGAEAIIVHLPEGCLATSEVLYSKGLKVRKLGRLALDQTTLEGIYRGTIKTWNELLTAQNGDGNDTITCTNETAKNDRIHPVVRRDGSGTTHIFKAFLEQVYTGKFAAEEFNELNGGENPCQGKGNLEAGAEESWEQMSEGCENQRWPEAAEVLRPATENGNPGVVNEVHKVPSSIGYADLAVAQELEFFTKKGVGGENKFGSETRQGEQHEEFWAVLQNTAPGVEPIVYSDPSTKADKAKEGNSYCKKTVYASVHGEEFPPESTRDDWSKVKGENVSETYAICGLTYVVAARQYWYFLQKYGLTEAESQAIATTVHDYLHWVVNGKKEGGAKTLKNSDYEGLPRSVKKEAEYGAEEIGNKKA